MFLYFVHPQKYIHKNPTGFGEYIQHSVIRQRLLSVLGPFEQKIVQILKEEMTDKQGKTKTVTTGVVLEMTFNIAGRNVSVQEIGDVEQPFNWKTEWLVKDVSINQLIRFQAFILSLLSFLTHFFWVEF